MRVKLQLVICHDDGHEETVTDAITLKKNNQRIEHQEHSVNLTLPVIVPDDAQTLDERSRYTWHSAGPTSGCY